MVIDDMEYYRRAVYDRLLKYGIETPRHIIFNRDKNNEPCDEQDEIEECDDVIFVKGHVFKKPFVEKPVDAEDHKVIIYYPSEAGGGCQILFRKIGNKSSVYSTNSRIRREGSYIYEDFMPTDGTDVKVYTIGEEYAHAEARKAPVLDGKVDRDYRGKELRYPVILNRKEKLIAQKVTKAFKQTVCGFDLLRANGKSYVCDVNGFSFVKTSKKYYDDCAQLLADIILKNLAPQAMATLVRSPASPATDLSLHQLADDNRYQLRSVVAIMRHGDRTPKQKMKLVVTHRLFFELFEKYNGDKEGRLKIKKPNHMQQVLDIVNTLIDGYDSVKSLRPIEESKTKLIQMKNVLEMYGTFNGINRKVQFKAIHDKRNAAMLNKLKGRNQRVRPDPNTKMLLVIVKWGGELTPMGKNQAQELGQAFRCLYSSNADIHSCVPGCALLSLHSTYKHNLKIYASDEGRVQMTAAAFAKGLLELEGELTPILVSLVKSNNYSTGMLDTPTDVDESMVRVKSKLHGYLRSDKDFSSKDINTLSLVQQSAVTRAIDKVVNPKETCTKVYELIDDLVQQVQQKCKEFDPSEEKLYCEENLTLMNHRWKKLKKDFYNGTDFDISLIPDIYDCVRYDYIHNKPLRLRGLEDLFNLVKPLADIVIPQEYGISCNEKFDISKQIAGRFYKKLQCDLRNNVRPLDADENPKDSFVDNENIRTRLYISSESHIHSVVNALRCGNMFQGKQDKEWEEALQYLNNVSELNYLTQIVFIQYEDMLADPFSDDRYKVSIYFSPGVKSPTTSKVAEELQELSSGNSMDYVYKSDTDLDAVKLAAEVQAKEREADESMRARREMEVIDEENGQFNAAKVDPSIKADIIETIPSVHPLVSLHRSINMTQMHRFLDKLKEKEWDDR